MEKLSSFSFLNYYYYFSEAHILVYSSMNFDIYIYTHVIIILIKISDILIFIPA